MNKIIILAFGRRLKLLIDAKFYFENLSRHNNYMIHIVGVLFA